MKPHTIIAAGVILAVTVALAATPISNLILTGNMDAGGFRITNLAAPSASADAATKDYTDTGLASYAVGANVRPVSANGYKYICTTSGTSGGTEPTWPTTFKGTVTDGSVTWTCAGADGQASGLIQFFVTGSNAETSITTANSTITADSGNKTIRFRITNNVAYFSVNGEAEVSITMLGGSFSFHPSFNVRNDTAITYPDLSVYTWRARLTGGTY